MQNVVILVAVSYEVCSIYHAHNNGSKVDCGMNNRSDIVATHNKHILHLGKKTTRLFNIYQSLVVIGLKINIPLK